MHLKRKFESGEFAILAEMEPPKGVEVSGMVSNARRVKGKVDALVVPEMSNAVMRMSSLGGAMILSQTGVETVFQVNCRDRNRIALQADLLAAAACGIPNVMAVAGEDPSYGDHHKARSVYDIDLLELLSVIGKLQQGKDMVGIELKGAPTFLVGSTAGLGAKGKSVEVELEEMKKKQDAGATFFITPPLFDLSMMEPFVRRMDLSNVKIVPTVMLLKSVGMARYIARNMAHIHVPDELITRIQKAPDKVRECVKIAAETIRAIRDAGLSGVMVATLGWENKLPDILEQI